MLLPNWLPTSTLLVAFSTLAQSQSAPPPAPAFEFAPSPTLRLSLLHRAAGQPTWHPRGYLELNPAANLAKHVPMAGGWDGLDWSNSPSPDQARYELAVAGAKDARGEWQDLRKISVPRCRLAHASGQDFEEEITVYVGEDVNAPSVAGLRYWTTNNGCKNGHQGSSGVVYGGEGLVRVQFGHAVAPEPVRFPEAKEEAPIKVGADGKIVTPEVEKTFLQKYWIYLVAGLLVIILAGGGEEPAAK